MAGVSPDDVLKVITCLCSPAKSQSNSKPGSLDDILNESLHASLNLLKDKRFVACVSWMCKVLDEDINNCHAGTSETVCNIDSLQSSLNQHSAGDKRWSYAIFSLMCLEGLNRAQGIALERYHVLMQDMQNARPAETSAPPISPDTLSIEQQKCVLTCLQFVVCLGVLPALHPGVGLPTSQRTEFSGLLQQGNSLSPEELEWRLFHCLKSLLRLLDQPSLATLILSRNFGDILAGLLQLCCASSLRQKSQAQATPTPINSNHLQISKSDVNFCESEIKKLLEKIYPPLIVRELLILQGGPGPSATNKGVSFGLVRSPAWLRRVCGQLLSDILMKPKGVQYVLKGLLHPKSESTVGGMEWQRVDAVAKVIAHCPRQSISLEDYYKAIGPQVLELLRTENGNQQARLYIQIAQRTTLALLQQQIALTLKYILQPLLQPLINCTQSISDAASSAGIEIVVYEKQLERCVEDIHKVFTSTTESQGLLISSLRCCVHVLMKLYCYTSTGVLHYKSKIEDIVLVYLGQSEIVAALECAKTFVFEDLENDDVSSGATKKGLKSPLMNRDVSFVPGPNGGVIAVRSTKRKETGSWEQRRSSMVELFHKLNNDGLSADFFIYLLQQLTVILRKEINLQSTVLTPGLDSLTNSTTEKERKELERILILLSLLASMCEKLGHTCFKSTRHILQFAKATLERGVQVLEKTEDVELGIFETETVTMAMGLLTAVIGGAAEITPADRESTKELLPLLEELSTGHPDESVREMATDLRIAIATHGFVLSHVLQKTQAQLDKSGGKAGKKMSAKSTEAKLSDHQRKPEEYRPVKDKRGDIAAHKLKISNQNNDTDATMENTKASGKERRADNPFLEASLTKMSVIDILAEEMEYLAATEQKHFQETDSSHTVLESGLTPTEKSHKRKLIEVLSSKENDENEITAVDEAGCNGHTQDTRTDAKQNTSPTRPRKDAEYRNDSYKPAQATPQSTSALDKAFQELLDPLVPVRGHALISLRRLLQDNDPEAVAKGDLLLKIFQENLDHSDTYIYLSAIQGLVALANHKPQKVVFVLAHEYANFDLERKPKRSPELRMKVGEVLTKCIRLLGDMLPTHGDLLLRCTLPGTRDPDSYVRASCLSNLAEICKLLRFSLGKVLFEVFECISALLKTDPEPEVRQAAAMFITLLLQGLAGDSFKVLDKVLRDLYRLLKHAVKTEKHDLVRMHAMMALQELDRIMEAFLFPKQSLSKKISITKSPDIDMGLKN